MVYCEDFGANWSLCMLVSSDTGLEMTNSQDSQILSRGLVPQGFYEVYKNDHSDV